MLAQSLSHVWLFVIPWTVAHHAPLSMEFSRQEYWRGLPCPHPGDDPPGSSEWQLRVLNARITILWPNRNLLLRQVVILDYCQCDMWNCVQYVVHTWQNMQKKVEKESNEIQKYCKETKVTKAKLKPLTETSLVAQWLRLHAPNAGGPGLIPGQGTWSHMPQLRPGKINNLRKLH